MPTASNTSVKLDTKTKKRVQRPAAQRRRSTKWVMCEEVEQYVEREEKSEKFRQDEHAAWTNLQATPLYITVEGVDNAAEADKWLAKLQSGRLRPSVKFRHPSQKKT